MTLLSEGLVNALSWWRIADTTWRNPLDPTFAAQYGGRWNPPASFPVLYLNENMEGARANFRRFARRWPYEPEDLKESHGPVLIECGLPERQTVCDVHTVAGVAAAGLPASYPLSRHRTIVRRTTCQGIGLRAKASALNGVHCRSAADPVGSLRELAWFPATPSSVAYQLTRLTFRRWYYRSSCAGSVKASSML